MGQPLSYGWGDPFEKHVWRERVYFGPAIAPLYAQAISELAAEADKAEAVYLRHRASVEAQEAARQAAYAAWQVPATE